MLTMAADLSTRVTSNAAVKFTTPVPEVDSQLNCYPSYWPRCCCIVGDARVLADNIVHGLHVRFAPISR
jgi:hypothetical protein